MNTYHFVVSEIFPDGRVLIVTYVRVGQRITLIMDVYDNGDLQTGKRYLDVHLNNNQSITALAGE